MDMITWTSLFDRLRGTRRLENVRRVLERLLYQFPVAVQAAAAAKVLQRQKARAGILAGTAGAAEAAGAAGAGAADGEDDEDQHPAEQAARAREWQGRGEVRPLGALSPKYYSRCVGCRRCGRC